MADVSPVKTWWWENSNKQKRFVYESATVSPKAVLFLFHGMRHYADHFDFRKLRSEWRSLGYYVIAYDQEGHGENVKDNPDKMFIPSWKDFINDGIEFIESIMATNAEYKSIQKLPFFVGGLSMGGCVSLLLSVEFHKLKTQPEPKPFIKNWLGTFMLAPALQNKLVPPDYVIWALTKILDLGGDKLCLGPVQERHYFPNDEIFDAFMTNPLNYRGNLPLRGGFEILEMTKYALANLDQVEFPFLVIHGKEDNMVPWEGSKLLMENSKTDPSLKNAVYLEDTTHFLIDPPEVCPTVINAISSFLDKRLQTN